MDETMVRQDVNNIQNQISDEDKNELMAARHTKEMVNLVKTASEEDAKAIIEMLLKKHPKVIFETLGEAYGSLQKVVSDIKDMVKL